MRSDSMISDDVDYDIINKIVDMAASGELFTSKDDVQFFVDKLNLGDEEFNDYIIKYIMKRDQIDIWTKYSTNQLWTIKACRQYQ